MQNNLFSGCPRSSRENALKSFRLYRCGYPDNLLQISNFNTGVCPVREYILDRGLFFTTQKGMALEYRQASYFCEATHKKPSGQKQWKCPSKMKRNLLLTVTGEQFLSSVQAQDLDVILLSHRDLVTFQHIIYLGTIQDEQVIQAFFAKKLYKSRDVDIAYLRRMCEIIVLLPEGVRNLAFAKSSIKRVKSLNNRVHIRSEGRFHEKIRLINMQPSNAYRALKKLVKICRKRRDQIIIKLSRALDEKTIKALREEELEVAKEAITTKAKLFKLRDELHMDEIITFVSDFDFLLPETHAECMAIIHLELEDVFENMGWSSYHFMSSIDQEHSHEAVEEGDYSDEPDDLTSENQSDTFEEDGFDDMPETFEGDEYMDHHEFANRMLHPEEYEGDDDWLDDSEPPLPGQMGPFWLKLNHFWEGLAD